MFRSGGKSLPTAADSASRRLAWASDSFTGKTILITGSNTGLGLHAAQHYLNANAKHVILGVRNLDKGESACSWLEKSTGRQGVVSVLPLDMNSFTSIKTFFDRHLKKFYSIDIAVLNAGLWNTKYVTSPEGWEETLQVNTISTTLLALLLLPKLRAAGIAEPKSLPRLVLVSSGKHASIAREAFPTPLESILQSFNVPPEPITAFDGPRQYSISKLLLMYTLEPLAKLATSANGEPEVIVTACNPGFCISKLGRQYDYWYMKAAMLVIHRTIAKSTEEGSRTLVASSMLGPEAQRCYFNKDKLDR